MSSVSSVYPLDESTTTYEPDSYRGSQHINYDSHRYAPLHKQQNHHHYTTQYSADYNNAHTHYNSAMAEDSRYDLPTHYTTTTIEDSMPQLKQGNVSRLFITQVSTISTNFIPMDKCCHTTYNAYNEIVCANSNNTLICLTSINLKLTLTRQ